MGQHVTFEALVDRDRPDSFSTLDLQLITELEIESGPPQGPRKTS
jgi:hypothetical protein